MSEPLIGIIGGSGLYEIEGLKVIEEINLETPFGKPSDAFMAGEMAGRKVVFLSRHGRGHRLSPSELNFRANIWGMKKLGVEWIIAVSAVGSMREEIHPGDMVIVDQFFDRTRGRPSTFFTEGVVAHVTFADPLCPSLRKILIQSGKTVGATIHEKGTYLCMEGPQFSTRSESNLYRKWGMDVIGMTNLQEAKLAREAEICYATIALSTDYDCWHEHHGDVTVDAIVAVLKKNVETAKKMIREAIKIIQHPRNCGCGEALKTAILTDRQAISPEAKKKLELIAGRYFS
ncbi:MAG: S-methyl-5'-thioadenosine phosphorylase [Deltaproteobacteria bacterium]|nr:S-methyl-5'-thioadenosine phosphorylase [Deltaproteobacteria bacterium]MBI4197094.1 S-methyl-5'-thioadenosine phosphorylase [Deltaproteobacteria bacterium]